MNNKPSDRDTSSSRSLRQGRWSEPLACYAVTKCAENRTAAVLSEPAVAKIMLSGFQHARTTNKVRLLAFCIMPDHYHLLLVLLHDIDLSTVIGGISKYTGREINRLLERTGRFWQDGFHDHRCRRDEDVEGLATYIENNPVRAGFIESAEDWGFSSASPSRRDMLDRDWYPTIVH